MLHFFAYQCYIFNVYNTLGYPIQTALCIPVSMAISITMCQSLFDLKHVTGYVSQSVALHGYMFGSQWLYLWTVSVCGETCGYTGTVTLAGWLVVLLDDWVGAGLEVPRCNLFALETSPKK